MRAPPGIFRDHLTNKFARSPADVLAPNWVARPPSPVFSKSSSMPPHHGFSSNDHQGILPLHSWNLLQLQRLPTSPYRDRLTIHSAFNHARGPVFVFGTRLHWEFYRASDLVIKFLIRRSYA